MSERYPAFAEPDPTELATYVDENYEGYEIELQQAIERANDEGHDRASIGRAVPFRISRTEKAARDQIYEKLKERFAALYPERQTSRVYGIDYGGQRALELDPPAYCFEIIRSFTPEKDGDNRDVKVTLIH